MQLVQRTLLIAFSALALMVGAASAQAQATKLLPNDTELVFTINLKQILESDVAKSNKTLLDFAKQAIEQKLDENPSSKYLKQADFNFLTDLHSITMAMPMGRDAGEGMIVLEGKFDAEKIEEAVTEAGKDAGEKLKVIEIGKTKAFEVAPKEDGKKFYAGVLNSKTMIVCSSKADFITAVARLAGSQQPSFKAEFKGAVAAINGKQSISLAATSAALIKLSEKAPEAAAEHLHQATDILKQLNGASVSITIQKDIDFQIGVHAKDSETANQYATFAKAGIEIAKKMASEKGKDDEKYAAASTIVNTIRVSTTGTALMIRGQIAFDTLEKILQLVPGLPGN